LPSSNIGASAAAIRPANAAPLRDDPAALIDRVLGRDQRLYRALRRPGKTPYLVVPRAKWKPRYSDYQHLERLEESEDEWW
jgi:hypothetical protein